MRVVGYNKYLTRHTWAVEVRRLGLAAGVDGGPLAVHTGLIKLLHVGRLVEAAVVRRLPALVAAGRVL